MKRSRYQFGGTDPSLYSLDNVYNALNRQQEQPQYEPDEVEQPDVPEEADDAFDYQDLMEKYTALEERFSALEQSRQDSYFNNFDDGFLDFLFSDDNNAPLSFDSQPQLRNTNLMEGIFRVEGARTGQPTNLNSSAIGRGQMIKGTRELMYKKLGITDIDAAEQQFKTDPEFESTVINAYIEDLDARIPQNVQGADREYLIAKGWYTGNPFYPDEKVPHPEAGNKLTAGEYAKRAVGKYQFGGVPQANTPDELYNGLNGTGLSELLLNLPKQYNVIRGLDSGQPVNIMDELGNEETLYGNEDQAEMYGKVHERKMQAGGRAPIYTSNPNDPRLKAYQDSLNVYNNYKKRYNQAINTGEIEFQGKNIPVYSVADRKYVTKDQYINQKYDKLKKLGITITKQDVINDWNFADRDGNKVKDDAIGAYQFKHKIGDGEYTLLEYKKPVQPVVLNKDIYLTPPNYEKKYPPIYLTNPNDPRIGGFKEEGNQYLYKKLVPKRRTSSAQLIPDSLDEMNLKVQGRKSPNVDVNKQIKTNYSFSYRNSEGGQSTKYFPDLSSWQDFMKDKTYINQKISGDKKSAEATGYYQVGGDVFKSQSEVNKALKFARDLELRNGAPANIVNQLTIGRVGDPIPKFEYQGIKPDNTLATSLPFGVTVNDVELTRDGYGYFHPQTGKFVRVNPQSIYGKYNVDRNVAKLNY